MRRLIGLLNGKAKWMGTAVLLFTAAASGQATPPSANAALVGDPGQTAAITDSATATQADATNSGRVILVSIPDRKLALLEDGKVVKVFTVAVGKDSTPSPTGTFTIKSRVANPTYYHKGTVIEPGPANPLGTRWMGLSEKGYGIHGTNAPKSIGKAASHGCIRMAKKDLEELFPLVKVGDRVEIRGERDAQMAAIFGTEGDATVATTVVAAATPAGVGVSGL